MAHHTFLSISFCSLFKLYVRRALTCTPGVKNKMFVDQIPLDKMAHHQFFCLFLLLAQTVCYTWFNLYPWFKDKMSLD
jgi:hypothetical protein